MASYLVLDGKISEKEEFDEKRLRGVSKQSKLPTRFINLNIFRDFQRFKSPEYTVNIATVNNYILVSEYTKMRI